MPQVTTGSQAKIRLAILLILGLTLFVYWPVGHFDFVNYDDNGYITENPNTVKGITRDNIVWAFTTVVLSNWHPLTMLSHMMDCQLFGLNAGGHHLTSVLFHLVDTVLLFCLLRRMTGSVWRSAFVAALFALHPLNVDSVAWIAERKNVLSTLFMFLTIGAYIRWARAPGLRNYVLILIMFALGLLSKPMLVTLPCLLLLLDYWPLKRFSAQEVQTALPSTSRRIATRLVLEKAPLFLLALVSCVITIEIQRASGSLHNGDAIGFRVRLANAVVSYAAYLCKMVWPVNLAVMYPHPGSSLPAWQVVCAAAFLAGMTGLAFWKARQLPYLITGWLWYLISLLPVIGLIQSGHQAMADRYAYVPLLGIFVLIAWGAAEAWEKLRFRQYWLTGLACCILVAFSLAARTQVSYWRNTDTLFEHAIQSTPDNYTAESVLGMSLVAEGRIDEAILHLTKSLAIHPNDGGTQRYLGLAYAQQGRYDEAIKHYNLALPYDQGAVIYNNLGAAFAGLGQYGEAIVNYSRALQIAPHFPLSHFNLAMAYAATGRFNDAMLQYTDIIRAHPNNVNARVGLGKLLVHHGDLADDLTRLLKPDQLQPYALLYNDMAQTAANQGKFEDAARDYQTSLKLDPANEEARRNLGLLLQRIAAMPRARRIDRP